MGGADDEADYDLIDLETGSIAGTMRGDGLVVAGDRRVRERVAGAFAHEVMVRDGEMVDDLGICFLDVQTLRPGEAGHAEIVVQNLGRLAGYLPRRHARRD